MRGKGNFVFLSGNGELGGRSGLFYPVDLGVVLCQPRHSQDYLGMSQSYDHKGQVFFEGGGFTMDFSGGCDSSLLISSSINIEGLEGLDWLRWEEKTLDKGWVNEVSSNPAIYKGCGGNGS